MSVSTYSRRGGCLVLGWVRRIGRIRSEGHVRGRSGSLFGGGNRSAGNKKPRIRKEAGRLGSLVLQGFRHACAALRSDGVRFPMNGDIPSSVHSGRFQHGLRWVSGFGSWNVDGSGAWRCGVGGGVIYDEIRVSMRKVAWFIIPPPGGARCPSSGRARARGSGHGAGGRRPCPSRP